MSTDSNNPTVMQYDGVINLWSEHNAQNQATFNVYVNSKLVQRSYSGNFVNVSVGGVTVKKGDEVYLTGTATPFMSEARFYKKRDYSNR